MARRKQRKLSKKETKALKKAGDRPAESQPQREFVRPTVAIEVPRTIAVGELSKVSGRTAGEIIAALLRNGVIASINDSIDRETVEILAEDLSLAVSGRAEPVEARADNADAAPRPPVVAVLGHVDHGKTTLLDSIREANVASGESGGITQHIGAYQVRWHGNDGADRPITFLDTPGHEAFSALRAHGATMTDIAILVVAADDGVKPQTAEALSHARAANVPVIVALNKIDKPEANPDRVKAELVELGLQPEDWGGKTPVVPVSAKQKTGIDALLDTVLLVADLADLKAPDTGLASGVVIESHKAPGIGPVATVLVQRGSLAVGDNIVIGPVYGKVRLLRNESGERFSQVGPATPIQVAGLADVPGFGERFEAYASEKQARDIARQRALAGRRTVRTAAADAPDEAGELALVLKTDVDGSLKAVRSAIEAIEVPGVTVRILHAGVGQVTESDIHLAAASQASILAFHTGMVSTAKRLAEQHSVMVNAYDVIYELTDFVRSLAEGAVHRERVQVEVGQLAVKALFRTTKTVKILGGVVKTGEARSGASVTIERAGESVGKGTVTTVQRGQQPAAAVPQGEECGLALTTATPVEIGDVLRFLVEEERAVVRSQSAVADVDNSEN